MILVKEAGGLVLSQVAQRFGKAIQEYLNANDVRLRDAWEHERRDHVVRKLAWLELTLEDLRFRVTDLGARLDAQSDDQQLHRVWDNFVYESIREAIFERREMLAAADAGIVEPSLSIEQKARVERTLRQLDPVDVRTLFAFDLASVPGTLASDNGSYQLWKDQPNGDILVSSGCLRLNPEPLAGFGGGGKPIPEMTPLGRDVLRVLRAYVRQRGPAFEVPGREAPRDAESRGEAWRLFDSTPGLAALLKHICHAESAFYRHPRAGGEAELDAYFTCTADEGLLQRQIMAVEGVSIPFRIAFHRSDSGLRVTIRGPHDLLGVLAYEAYARWSWT